MDTTTALMVARLWHTLTLTYVIIMRLASNTVTVQKYMIGFPQIIYVITVWSHDWLLIVHICVSAVLEHGWLLILEVNTWVITVY